MKILFLLLLAATLSSPALAAEKNKKRAPDSNVDSGAHVIQLDPDFPIQRFDRPGIQIHTIESQQQSERMLAPWVQDQMFEKAGLTKYVAGWDAFDRDRLALRAENQDAREVADRYNGKIPAEAIHRLQSLIKEYRKSQERR